MIKKYIKNDEVLKKIFLLKKIVFVVISISLLFDCLFLPFVTEPFSFQVWFSEEYIFGVIFALLVWSYFVWLNFSNLRKIKFLCFENTAVFTSSHPNKTYLKKYYYFHLKMGISLVTIFFSGLILLGVFSLVDQYDMALRNLSDFFSK